jgi:hypothetical protein
VPSLALPAPRSRLFDVPSRLTVLPDDMPQGHASGAAPFRLLLLGADAVAGRGVRSHQLSLAGCLARAIAGNTGHGADVDLVVADRSTPGHLDDLLRQHDVTGLDGVVLVLDDGRRARVPAAFGPELRRLLMSLLDRLPQGSPITVVVAPRLRDSEAEPMRDAGLFTKLCDAVTAAVGPLASVVSLPAGSGSSPSAGLYRAWADEIACALLPNLEDPQLWRGPARPLDERARQRAVRELGRLDEAWEAEFERFVCFARAGYGTRSASLSVIDGPRTRFLVRQGVDFEELPREDTICDSVISAPGGIIVGDARQDPRFRDIPPVADGTAAFYAGYRVESPNGQPVAVLCVFDPEPRPVLTQDIALLRDLALAAQRRVWELDRAGRR